MQERNGINGGLALAELLATRLCHDLSGHIHALGAAIEAIQDEQPAPDEAMSLASDAVDGLVRRLRLLRAAWGIGAVPLGVAEIQAITDGVFGRRLRLDVGGLPHGASFPPAAARLLLNVVLLAAESLPAGGVVELAGDPGRDLVVTIAGPRAGWPPGLAAMLADPAEVEAWLRDSDHVVAARGLQAPLTALMAQAAGLRLTFLLGAATEAAPPLLVGLAPLH